MSKSGKNYVPASLRKQVRERANTRCEYCLELEYFATASFHIDHIISEQHDGLTVVENLAFACGPCNLFKGPNLVTTLPGHEGYINLFHPRKELWADHFVLEPDGSIKGLTLTGTATAKLLNFNTTEQLIARKRLIDIGAMKVSN